MPIRYKDVRLVEPEFYHDPGAAFRYQVVTMDRSSLQEGHAGAISLPSFFGGGSGSAAFPAEITNIILEG
jgi:hypothetical protein